MTGNRCLIVRVFIYSRKLIADILEIFGIVMGQTAFSKYEL